MSRLLLLALLSPVALSAGCATTYSDERLKFDTAELLGGQADQVVISDRRLSGPTIFYTAKTKSAEYSCATVGGSVKEFVMNMGVTSLPKCQKKDEPPNNNP